VCEQKKGKGKGRCCGAHSALPVLKADCTLAPEVVLPSSPEALRTKRRERPVLAKEGNRTHEFCRNFTAVVGVFDMPQSWDMVQII
jgi:hypothetical protein